MEGNLHFFFRFPASIGFRSVEHIYPSLECRFDNFLVNSQESAGRITLNPFFFSPGTLTGSPVTVPPKVSPIIG